eukprot:gene11706-12775_t
MTKVIYECKFLPEDDFSYLSDDSKWIRRLSYRVTPEEMKEKVVPFVRTLLNDLDQQPNKLDLIIEKVFSRGAEHTYLIEVKLTELDFNQRKEIEACFVASVIRHLILKTPAEVSDTSQAREEFRKRLVEEGVENSYADFMQNEVGSDSELTCLYRFERAVLIAKTYISGNRNKGLFLSVGSLLEGSEEFTKYITGGHASKETKRRVALIERLCGIQPRKRIRKLAPESSKVQKEVAGSLLQLADIALSRESEDFSSLGLSAEAKMEDNTLYREYVGKERATSNSVRIKVYNNESEYLFYREVELLKKLNQRDCALRVLRSVEEDNDRLELVGSGAGTRKLIVFEHCPDCKVTDLIGANVLAVADAWLDVMEAVQCIHSSGVVIRNLKPENIYLLGPLHNPRVKIGGFTFAQRVAPDIWSENSLRNLMLENEENKLKWESRLDYALLKDSMFVAPEVFAKQAGFKADVWSLGLLGLFLVKHVLPWKEVQYVQEKSDGESEQKMREMLDRLSWVYDVESGLEREDIVTLGVLKNAIASCLHVSVKQRSSLLEVKNAVRQRVILAKNVRKLAMRQERKCCYVQSLQAFGKCVEAIRTVCAYENLMKGKKPVAIKQHLETELDFLLSRQPALLQSQIASISLADHSDKTLLSGRFTIINTFLRTEDYECHIVLNNTSQRTQVLKHIKAKNIPLDQEISILRSISNEVTISEVEDYVDDGFQKYVAVGWLEGGWLLNVLNDHKVAGQRMSEKCLQSVAGGLVSAMKYLHGRGIIYRGLNLSRVLTKRVSEDEMMVKLWDFGPAILKDGAMLSSSVGVNASSSYGGYAFPSAAPSAWMHYPEDGEDGYYCMAPELLRNLAYIDHKQKYDERVDAWSVGMVLYLLVEGKSCFSVGDARSVLESIESWRGSKGRLNFRNNLVSEDTKSVITGLLRVSPNERLSWSSFLLLGWCGLKEINIGLNEDGSASGWAESLSWKGIGTPSFFASHPEVCAPYPIMSPIAACTDYRTEPNICDFASSSLPVSDNFELKDPPYELDLKEDPCVPFLSRKRTNADLESTEITVKRQHISPDYSEHEAASFVGRTTDEHHSVRERKSDITGSESNVQDLLQRLHSLKECYLKYLEYQSAILSDDFDKAERLSSELSDIDESELSDSNRFKATYSTMLESLANAIASWKEVVKKTPKLFEQYKEKCILKKDLENFLETLP